MMRRLLGSRQRPVRSLLDERVLEYITRVAEIALAAQKTRLHQLHQAVSERLFVCRSGATNQLVRELTPYHGSQLRGFLSCARQFVEAREQQLVERGWNRRRASRLGNGARQFLDEERDAVAATDQLRDGLRL